jgi:hypothetical protein
MQMRAALHFIDSNSAEFIIGLTVLTVVLFFYCVYLSRKVARAAKRRGQRPPGENVGEIMDCLRDQSEAIADLQSRAAGLAGKLDDHGQTLQSCIQRTGLVRFNAFDDVGGEQSFALVLVDGKGDGVAVSSIYGRQDSRFYAKPINSANGDRPLSDEERQALANATAPDAPAVGTERGPR